MLRKLIALLLLTVMVSSCAYACKITAEQQAVAEQLIRLHVVANSDSERDQHIKLVVRDAVLQTVTRLTGECCTAAQAQTVLRASQRLLQATAHSALTAVGCTDPVAVSLQAERFDRRVYDTFSLPAGDYLALRVVIGAGDGHNWWCVAFPALCIPATSEGFAQAAAASGFSDTQTDLLTGEETTVEIKFRALEWLAKLKELLCSR